MKISKEEVEKLAHLARLEFSEEEKLSMQADMDKILGFVDKINELDLEGVEPLVYLNEDRNIMRADKVEQNIKSRIIISGHLPLRGWSLSKSSQ